MIRLYLSISLLGLACFSLGVGEARAFEPELEVFGPVERPVPKPEHEQIERLFYQSVQFLNKGQLPEFAEKILLTRNKAISLGYKNLPEFSTALLSQARHFRKQGNDKTAGMLILQAVHLSPEDSRIYFAAASFTKIVGLNKAISFFYKGLKFLPRYPLTMAKLLLNVLMLGVLAYTLSLLVCFILNLCASGETLLRALGDFFPLAYRGVLTPILALSLLVLPLFGGLLLVLGIWSLALAWERKSCRFFPPLVGILAILWSLAVPVYQTVSLNSQDKLLGVIENLNNAGFVPNTQATLQEFIEQGSDDPFIHLSRARVHYYARELKQAEKILLEIIENNRGSAQLRNSAIINLALVYYQVNRLQEAYTLLQGLVEKGQESFELSYSLAHVSLALLRTEEHRKYYLDARTKNEPLLNWYEQQKIKTALPALPAKGFVQYLVQVPEEMKSLSPLARRSTGKDISAHLFAVPSSLALQIFGLLLILALQPLAKRWSAPSEFSAKKGSRSMMWTIVPGGIDMIGDRPVRGAAVLMLVFFILMMTYGEPLKLLPLSPVVLTPTVLYWSLLVAIILLSTILSLSSQTAFEKKRRRALS